MTETLSNNHEISPVDRLYDAVFKVNQDGIIYSNDIAHALIYFENNSNDIGANIDDVIKTITDKYKVNTGVELSGSAIQAINQAINLRRARLCEALWNRRY